MNTSIKIKLNGVWITGRIDGTSSFEVTLRRSDANGQTAKSFSSELTFYDDGYQILKTALIDDPNGFANEVPIEVWDDCCGTAQFVGVIKGDAIDWCEPDCSISANAIETTPELNCVQSTILWDNWNGFLYQNRPAMRYCIDHRPAFIQLIILWVAFLLVYLVDIILIPLFIVLLPLFVIFFIVCSIVCALPGTDCTQDDCNESDLSPWGAFQLIGDINAEIAEWVIPCGFYHPSALVRDYILNVCGKCGLTFQSSILNDPASPYWNTVLWAAQVRKGFKKDETNFMLISENLPVETLGSFLDNVLKPTFNADWRLYGNTLVFERKDFFQGTTTWIDAEQLLNNNMIEENKICFSWIDRERWAFARLEYQPDAQEYLGNEAAPRFNDIVDWNVPFNPAQSGQYTVSLPLSPVRTREDKIRQNFYEYFENAAGGIVNWFFGGTLSDYSDAMLLNDDTGFNYKLLIWDGQSMTNGSIRGDYSDSFTGGSVVVNGNTIPTNARHNYPFWFKENNANNLYTLFHYIDDPRNPTSTQFEFDFSFQFSCSDLANFDWSKTVRMYKNGSVVFGQITEVKLNFVTRLATVSGIV
jgi:hypothetical protein